MLCRPTATGRAITVVYTVRKGRVRVVKAFPAKRSVREGLSAVARHCARADAEEGICQGLDVAHGRTRPAREVFDEIRRKHDIPR